MLDKKAKIYIAGHHGMVGSNVVGLLKEKGYQNLIFMRSCELDLRNQKAAEEFISEESPDYVFLFAAKVGGIKANIDCPAQFLYDNIMIEANVIHASCKYKVKKLLYLGSSCVYPRQSPQPMKEEYLLTDKLEPTNEGYALAKIVGLKLCEYYNREFNTNFISLMPSNLYGPNDNFSSETSHVIAALIRRLVEAKRNNSDSIEVWGIGIARREFLYVEDLARACIYFMESYDAKDLPFFINVGYGKDVTIKELVEIIKSEVCYEGKVVWNTSFPDGMPQKLLDSTLAGKFGWHPQVSLREGIKKTVEWYLNSFHMVNLDEP